MATKRLGITHLTAHDEGSQTTWFVKPTEPKWIHQTCVYESNSLKGEQIWKTKDSLLLSTKKKKNRFGSSRGGVDVGRVDSIYVVVVSHQLFFNGCWQLVCRNQNTRLDCIIGRIKKFKHVWLRMRSCWVCFSHMLTDFHVSQPWRLSPTNADSCRLCATVNRG